MSKTDTCYIKCIKNTGGVLISGMGTSSSIYQDYQGSIIWFGKRLVFLMFPIWVR